MKTWIPYPSKDGTPIHENTEDNITSNNNKEKEEEKKNNLSKIIKYYEDNITLIVPIVVEEMASYLEDGIKGELIIACIKEAVDRNCRNWKYIKTILNDCSNNNVCTVRQYKIKQKEYRETKEKQQQVKTQQIKKQDTKYTNDFSEYDNYVKRD